MSKNHDQLLKDLWAEMESHRVGDVWKLPVNYALSILQNQKEYFLRYCYRIDRSESEDRWPEDFTSNNIGKLVGFLDWQGFTNASQFFFTAGYYLSAEKENAWLEFFQSYSHSWVQNCEVDRELLELALSSSSNFEIATEFYCYNVVHLEDLLRKASDIFIQRNRIAEHSHIRSLLMNCINNRFGHRDRALPFFFPLFRSKLLEKCEQWDLPGFKKFYKKLDKQWLSQKIREALHILDLDQKFFPPREKLRKRYCQFLKKYHPDLHRNGEEQTRRLIEAYHVLLTKYPSELKTK